MVRNLFILNYFADYYAIEARIKKVSRLVSVQTNIGLSKHHFYNRVMYMAIKAEDIHWVLDNYKPLLARFGYDLLYEVWLDAIEGHITETVAAAQIMQLMKVTRGLGNWGEYWSS